MLLQEDWWDRFICVALSPTSTHQLSAGSDIIVWSTQQSRDNKEFHPVESLCGWVLT